MESAGDVVFDDVTFAYAEDSLLSKSEDEDGDGRRDVLRHLNLHLRAGRDRRHGRTHRQRQVDRWPGSSPASTT